MYVYIYEGYQGGRGGRQRTEALVRRAAKLYAAEERLNLGAFSDEILRAERGKPYFEEIPIEFSVSHTGSLWVCSMGAEAMGIDVQEIRGCRREKIADRYYTADEREYVRANGEAGFFQIWTRKEAYAKYTGDGFTESLRVFSTLAGKDVEFIDFDIGAGVKGSCCVREKCELWIRKIL
ncbi:4'-phosphopantetheinyl transferase superfamily protein [Anaerovorax odorimutans]|uniref:4'-phosphopantetheinyl transferase superfamily protein n=1 Tax=Anaerovorax odorimutans TaxID=109327 RepID=A0ABT1RRD7_9FIRM|nr:4'-phosphopantetheinyl transferase superfamily protein [Anaerovorax odorimutans]MCQ4637762.1 4'-phosphopantetheinyl transferase superfamily protein [Anaerovorax odorimutans]